MSAPLVAATLHTGAVHATTQFLSESGGTDSGGQGEDFGKSTPLGLLLLVLFLIAVAFLIRSMSKHLKRVPQSFTDEADESAPDEEESAEAWEAAQSSAQDNATAGDEERPDGRSDGSPRTTS